jgi:PiT family inorganic phosphate transporter
MGLIMLILIGSVPTAFALNHAMPTSATPAFYQASEHAQSVFSARATGSTIGSANAARGVVTAAVQARQISTPESWAALGTLVGDIAQQVRAHGEMNSIPAAAVPNVRNDMYLVSEGIRLALKSSDLSAQDTSALTAYRGAVDAATKFIPVWVKVAVAIALGLGTMIGWKRIVVTVGEKIGKSHLTYGQGAAAELIAAATIGAADSFGLPVSTTHVLSSGIAGTMAANGSGLQWSTVRSIALAWVLTLPAAMLLSGTLYWLLRQMT